MKEELDQQKEMGDTIQKLSTDFEQLKTQVDTNSEQTQKLNTLTLLNPAENCQQLKDLGFSANGLYPLEGLPPKFEHCQFTESISSDCKFKVVYDRLIGFH